MGKYSLEEYLKGRIRGHREDIDTDELWKALDLEPKKKKPWWILGAVLLLLATCIGVQQYPTKSRNYSQIENSIEKKSDIEQKNNIGQHKESQKTSETTSLEPLKKVEKIAENTTSQSSNNSLEQAQNTNKKATKPAVITEESVGNYPVRHEQVKSKLEELATDKVYKPALTNEKKSGEGVVGKPSTLINQAAYNPIKIAWLTSLLNVFNIDQRSIKMQEATETIKHENPPSDKQNPWSIAGVGGLYYVDRELNLTNDNLAEHFGIRNRTETSLESIMLGVNIRYEINDHWYIKSGLEFQSINERFNVQITNDSTFFKDNEPIILLVEETGDTIIQDIGLAEFLNSRTEIWEHYNNHRFINVPLSLGFKSSKNAWSFFAEASPLISYYQGFHGRMINLDGDATTRNPAYFNNKWGLGLRLNLGVSYQLKQWNVFVAPSAQQYLFSVSQDGFGIDQNYRMIGGNIGLRYKLN